MLLASIGLYAVVAFSAAQRTRELGIRVALGVQYRKVHEIVGGEGMALVGVGLAIGLAVSAAAMRPLAGLLHGVPPTDVVTFGGVPVILVAVAFLASLIPARRAARGGSDDRTAIRLTPPVYVQQARPRSLR